jgi:rubrerythrin
LAADEQAHRGQFEALLEKVEPDDEIMTREEKHRYLCAMARSEFFKGDTGLATMMDSVQSLNEALTHALGFEKATLGFYVALQEVVGEDERLGAIIEAEKGHIARLMKYILSDEKMEGLGDRS